ncbi:MAG: imidazole glycerol phosphate synthase subunit HisH [Actinomycetales bacterium]|nr:imidazole glycerol phosphate synthase subunit HisH [Actinomycetales bacterium]
MTKVVVLDYGSGNLRSAARALETTGVEVLITSDFDLAMNSDGLVVPGVGAFSACMAGLKSVRGDQIIERRLAGGRPVLGICVGMQVLFSGSTEHVGENASSNIAESNFHAGLDQWPDVVTELSAQILPHMGWNTVSPPSDSGMFRDISQERFYFVHSYAAQSWTLPTDPLLPPAKVTWSEYGTQFVAAIENGPLWATQFHPEKSGQAGLALLKNWTQTL